MNTSRGEVDVVVGDITTLPFDAIVNAANSSLLGGGGVDGAIHRVGGPAILHACRAIRAEQYPEGLPTGEAVATEAGDLPAHYVIHTVGPIWRGGQAREKALLKRAIDACFTVAQSLFVMGRPLRTIAFPALSTGVYGYPKAQAFPLITERLRANLSRVPHITRVTLVVFSQTDLEVYNKVCR